MKDFTGFRKGMIAIGPDSEYVVVETLGSEKSIVALRTEVLAHMNGWWNRSSREMDMEISKLRIGDKIVSPHSDEYVITYLGKGLVVAVQTKVPDDPSEWEELRM